MIPKFNKIKDADEANKYMDMAMGVLQHPKHKKNKVLVQLSKLAITACGASYQQAQFPHEFLFLVGEVKNPDFRVDWQNGRDAAQGRIEALLAPKK